MIKAYRAGYIKYDSEEVKRRGQYCIIEMTIETMPHIQVLIIGKDGLISAHLVGSITEITGFHRYMAVNGHHLGVGELQSLDTSNPKGMLEGLSAQLEFNYTVMAKGFGEGLLRLADL